MFLTADTGSKGKTCQDRNIRKAQQVWEGCRDPQDKPQVGRFTVWDLRKLEENSRDLARSTDMLTAKGHKVQSAKGKGTGAKPQGNQAQASKSRPQWSHTESASNSSGSESWRHILRVVYKRTILMTSSENGGNLEIRLPILVAEGQPRQQDFLRRAVCTCSVNCIPHRTSI